MSRFARDGGIRFEAPQMIQDFGSWLSDAFDQIPTGLENAWYNLTGQTEKTSAYQAMMEREDSAYQRAAEDMRKAGLSKFGGVTPASSTSPANSDPVARRMELEQLRGVKLSNDLAKHDLSINRKFNLRSGDKNPLAGLNAIFGYLFGDQGLFPGYDDKIIDWFKGVLSGLFGDGSGSDVPVDDVPKPVSDNYVPIIIDSMPTGSQLGADADKNKAMVLTLDQLQSLQGQSARDWVNTFLVEEGRLGRGKEGNYRSLPSALTSQVDKGFDADLKHFGDNLRSSAYASDKTVVGNFARVLANKYHRSYDDVYKALWSYANGSDSASYEVK